MNKSGFFTLLIVLFSWVGAGTIVYLTRKEPEVGIIAIASIIAVCYLTKWAIFKPKEPENRPEE